MYIDGHYVKDIVTLSGDIGGGKSSVARILTEALGFQLISAGGLQREIAASMGLTTLQLNELSADDRSVDDKIDSRTQWLGENSDRIIVDSRLAWHFIPGAYKVFLSVDPAIGFPPSHRSPSPRARSCGGRACRPTG